MKSSSNKSRRLPWLPVVAAVIRREDKVLMGLRPQSGSLAGLWEFPGGKIEAGEQPEAALYRELKEELGINAEIGPLLFAAAHSYEEIGVILLFYQVNFWTGQPSTQHHSELKWVTGDELKRLDLPEANKNILDRVLALLKQ